MRWTIWVDGDDIYTKPLPGWTKVEVIPASFTDSDVERVAEALCRKHSGGDFDGDGYWLTMARAALEAWGE